MTINPVLKTLATDPDGILVVGAGPVGCATAAYIAGQGLDVAMWSPTGKRLTRVNNHESQFQVAGQPANTMVRVKGLVSKDAIKNYATVIVCLPATAYRPVFKEIIDSLVSGQTLIISGALSFFPLWLHEQSRKRGKELCVIGWGTTLTTAHFLADGSLHMNPVRDVIPLFPVGANDQGQFSQGLCRKIFGDRFLLASSLVELMLSNINPIAHAAEVMPNLTRMEQGEDWPLFGNFQGIVASLASALDDERLRIASAFGIRLRTLTEHYRHSYHVQGNTLAEVAAQIESSGQGPDGPKTVAHRYVLEDMPFGLVVYEGLAQSRDVPVPAISACITLFNIFYGCDFRQLNDLIGDLDFKALVG